MSPCGREVVAGQRKFHRELIGNALREPNETTSSGDEAALRLGNPEHRGSGRHDEVGGECEFGASGQCESLDGSNHGFAWRSLGESESPSGDGRVLAANECLEVHPCAEVAAGTGEDGNRERRILVESIHGVRQGEADFSVDGVPGFGAVDGDEQDAFVLFDCHS